MREALDRVQSELGREAVILATRQVPVKRLLPWGNREEVEITAGLGIATKPLPTRMTQPMPRATVPQLNPQERRAADIIEALQQRGDDVTFERTFGTRHDPRNIETAARVRPDFRTHATSPRRTVDQQSAAHRPANDVTHSNEISKRLDVIEKMLADLGRRHRGAAELPADVVGVYNRLLTTDVDEPIARELATTIQEELSTVQIADPAAVRMKLTQLVESELRCCGPVAVERGVRKIVALAGPTGVGKTTTLAKLAANFRLRDGLRTGLVTMDTYRIAAVDQLRTYADIIDLPMKVVTTPAEMRTALDELDGLDLVLIDTAGRSPRDAEQIAELNDLLAAANPDETHLVLSLTAGRKTLAQAVERFSAISPTAIIVTKLDEADAAGPILALCRDGGLPISYITLGQDVPDDIEPARPDRIARWIVDGGRDRGSGTRGQGAEVRGRTPTS